MGISIEELEKMSTGRVQISELPSEFIGSVERVETRKDTRGRDCLFLTVSTDNGNVTFKYTPMHLDYFTKELKRLGITFSGCWR
jgi:hypothetical protein